MPSGYLVNLSDGTLDAGDTIGGAYTALVAASYYPSGIGFGEWKWSGEQGGIPVPNQTGFGFYYISDDGAVYFVPEDGSVDQLDAATASNPPAYTTPDGIVEGTDGDDIIDPGYGNDPDGDRVDNGDGTGDAVLTFPTGESIILNGILASQLSSTAALETIGISARTGIPYFAAGTRIATPAGDVLVEDLKAGDLVMTIESGPRPVKPRPVKWISNSELGGESLFLPSKLNPVRIKENAMGNRSALLVSS